MSHLRSETIDLTQIPLFCGVEDSALGSASDWVSYFRDGQRIFAQGDAVESLIVILRGEIQISSQAMSMRTRRQHEIVGEQGFLSSTDCRSADAVACETVEVIQIPGAIVRRLLETNLAGTSVAIRRSSSRCLDTT